MGQRGFVDLDERYRSLDAKKDPLVFLNEVVPWEDFRARSSAVWRKPDEERKNAAGRKPGDEIVIFKRPVLQALYRSSMRLRTWTATSISVARRSSVCARSPSPITRLKRPIVASARERLLYPAAVCQAIRPRSAMS